MTENWNMQSNIKAKPGSQGTLFQPASKSVLNPQQRWPQGYTPERLNEVREGLEKTVVTHPDHLEDSHEPGDYRDIMGYRERVARSIAKSTVPPEHLEGLKAIHGHPDADDHGTYWPKRKQIGIDMTQGGDIDRTLIHEIGHHVHNDGTTSQGSMTAFKEIERVTEKHAWQDKSKYHDKPTGSGFAMAHNKVQAGVHEALADNYLTEHYRTGGRKSEGITEGAYEKNFTSDRREAYYPGYNDVRPPQVSPTLQGMQFRQGELISRNTVERDQERKQNARKDATSWAVGHTE